MAGGGGDAAQTAWAESTRPSWDARRKGQRDKLSVKLRRGLAAPGCRGGMPESAREQLRWWLFLKTTHWKPGAWEGGI